MGIGKMKKHHLCHNPSASNNIATKHNAKQF